jgi:hypothetical protein
MRFCFHASMPLYLLKILQDVSAQVRTLALSQSMTGQNITVDGGSSI